MSADWFSKLEELLTQKGFVRGESVPITGEPSYPNLERRPYTSGSLSLVITGEEQEGVFYPRNPIPDHTYRLYFTQVSEIYSILHSFGGKDARNDVKSAIEELFITSFYSFLEKEDLLPKRKDSKVSEYLGEIFLELPYSNRDNEKIPDYVTLVKENIAKIDAFCQFWNDQIKPLRTIYQGSVSQLKQ